MATRRVAHILVPMVTILIALLLLTADAKVYGQANMCAELVRPISIPLNDCGGCSFWEWFAVPHCCAMPAACLVSPECEFRRLYRKIEAGELYCGFSAEEFLDQILAQNIANLSELTLAGLPSTVLALFDAYAAMVAASGRPFSSSTQQALRDLIEPVYDHGDTGYSYADISSVRILSDSNPDAARFFRGQSNINAVTFGQGIVFRDEYYRLLQVVPSLDSIQRGHASAKYAEALELAVHEMVHVAQHRRYGYSVFRNNYVFDYLAGGGGDEGYRRSRYEDEVYAFSAELAATHGGWYCADTRPLHEQHIQERELFISLSPCTPLFYGNSPLGQCALEAVWLGQPRKPNQQDVVCEVASPYPNETALIRPPWYAIEADEMEKNCRWVRGGTAAEPEIRDVCDIVCICPRGELHGGYCFLGRAPDGTRAAIRNKVFVYLEPVPRPIDAPSTDTPPTRPRPCPRNVPGCHVQ